jgi:hypothetical protein
MLSRLSLLSLLSIVVLVGVSACDGETTPPLPGRPSLIGQFPDGPTLESNGITRRRILLAALNADRQPDLSAVTVTAPAGGGFLALVGGAEVEGTLPPTAPAANGQLEIEYRCVLGSNANIALTAENESTSTTLTVNCKAPAGDVIVALDDGECATLQATGGGSRCRVGVTLQRDTEAGPIAVEGNVSVSVVAPAGGELVASDAVAAGQEAIAIATDAEGSGSFFVVSTSEPGTVEIAAAFEEDEPVTLEIEVAAFENDSEITTDAPADVIEGDSVDVTISVLAVSGNPPSGADASTVNVRLQGAGTLTGADSTGTLENVALDVEGQAVVTVVADAIDTASELMTLTVSYDVLENTPPLVQIVTINVIEEGALLLNLAAATPIVKSDEAAEQETDIVVTFQKDRASVPGGTVLLTIDDPSRLEFLEPEPNIDGEVLLTAAQLTGDGIFTVTVGALLGVPPGSVTVSASAIDGADVVVDEIIIEVERAPQLSSIVPSPPAPAILGVRGSSLPTSSIVKFTLKDDLDQPMPNVRVEFEVPDTADPGIFVVADAISDANGLVGTVLTSGTVAGPVVVNLLVDTPQGPLTVSSPPIAIVGGLPNQHASFMSCATAANGDENTTVGCKITLVDRFSDLTPSQLVQFRSEGSGTIQSATTGGDGSASAQITLDDGDTFSATSVPAWSFGFIPDGTDPSFDGCDDGTAASECLLLDICDNDILECPLPFSCVDRAEAAGALLVAGLGARDPEMVDYMADFRACGFPVSCLLPFGFAGGVPGFDGDECAIAQGCFDYDASTECPHDGLITVIGSTRGEEGFTDGNGDGTFNFEDINGDGDQDEGEPATVRPELCIAATACEVTGNACTTDAQCFGIIPLDVFSDLPEPFTDKNDNCVRDDLTNSPRLFFSPSEKIRHSDVFSDIDGNGVFGFDVGTDVFERNGVYDEDAEIFLQSHVVVPGDTILTAGATCTPNAVAPDPACREGAKGRSLNGINFAALDKTLDEISDPSENIDFRWHDVNGNCPLFTTNSVVSVTGSIVIAGGAIDVELDCGERPAPNPLTAYCEDLPELGAPTLSVQVASDCAENTDGTNTNQEGEVKFTLGGTTVSIGFSVTCPPPT